ncbi:hypothetical protein ACFVJ3_41850 [Rhodococcus sp. NPDC127593]|uniref:hypothetical protein n=1 Tax=Rhodococcus sp. NPDC127593 TaxID=3345404 RepID=UPI00362A7E1F
MVVDFAGALLTAGTLAATIFSATVDFAPAVFAGDFPAAAFTPAAFFGPVVFAGDFFAAAFFAGTVLA